jgi:hypothetical protein
MRKIHYKICSPNEIFSSVGKRVFPCKKLMLKNNYVEARRRNCYLACLLFILQHYIFMSASWHVSKQRYGFMHVTF